MHPIVSNDHKILKGHGITLTFDQQNPCLLQSISLWKHISNCIMAINKTRIDFHIQLYIQYAIFKIAYVFTNMLTYELLLKNKAIKSLKILYENAEIIHFISIKQNYTQWVIFLLLLWKIYFLSNFNKST